MTEVGIEGSLKAWQSRLERESTGSDPHERCLRSYHRCVPPMPMTMRMERSHAARTTLVRERHGQRPEQGLPDE